MKKTKKIVITVISIICVLAIIIFGYYYYFYDANKLNLKEKKWLDDNKTNVISFNVPSDLNVFALNGSGVFYDFLDDLAKNYDLKINKNIVNATTNNSLGFTLTKEKNNEDLLLYKDHYVVVSKNNDVITSLDDLKGNNIGGLADAISRVSASYNINAKFASYETKANLLSAIKDDNVKYIIVPLNEFIDSVLTNNYNIVYHLSDLDINYYLHLGKDETLNSIIKKYYNEWINTSLEESYYTNNYNLFVENLGLTQVQTDSLTNKTYTYGFVPSSPYASLSGSKYGGIIFSYLDDFSKFSKVDFTYTKYKNDKTLIKSFNDKKVDLIFNNTNLLANDFLIKTNFNHEYYLISNLKNNLFASNINEISGDIYVIENSLLADYLNDKTNIKLNYVDDEEDLVKAYRKDKVIAIDANTYNYLVNDKIKNSYIALKGYTTDNYSYRYQNNDDTFYKLFSSYISYLDQNKMTNKGILSFKKAATSGNIVSTMAKYILIVISAGIVIVGLIITSKKHLKLDTKIRKDEKLKFIDMLTSLKNRNYLNEKIGVWNQNTIYPQAVIVIDLNNIKYLNDTFGHEEGDSQIKSAANALIKTQLDNSEIMRTDGNEFMIYMVGYTEKQVINYMKKLVKEFKTLPYEYGAAFGFSMIVDDLKLLDDAINEATIQMRSNKENSEASNAEKEE